MRVRPVTLTVGAAALVVALVAALPGSAAAPAAAAPTAAVCPAFTTPAFDPSVVTPRQVIGIDLGDRDVTTAESDAYLQALAAQSDRVTDGVAATSVQGRPLRYAAVGRPEWTSSTGLQALSDNIRAIRDPRTDPAVAAQLVATTPQVLWVAGNVHGNEESGADAALRVAYELAARTDCAAQKIRDEAVVFVLPTQNPDGREADTRRNALGFDMNRDWFARTQPETDGKLEVLRAYPPQVFIDDHEMGTKGFFFPPNADPVHHEIGEAPLGWIYDVYGPAMQDAFTSFKYKYFNGSTYDLFYMGYGDTVPAAGFNAAGMTFEKHNGDKASVRVQQQYVAIWATLSAAAGQGRSLLSEWRGEFVTAQQEGAAGLLEPNQLYYEGSGITTQVPDIRIRSYFLRADDPSKADEVTRIVRRLQRMDVEVRRLTAPLTVPDYTPYGGTQASTVLPEGTYWVTLDQFQKHWIQAMLGEDPYVPFPYFYDVTAWSLPLLGNVAGGRSGAVLSPSYETVPELAEPPARPLATQRTVALWEVGTSSGTAFESAGWMRWYLKNRLDQPWTETDGAKIATGGLAGVDVLVMGNGAEKTALSQLGSKGKKVLADWVRAGGTLVAFRESARLAATLGLTTASYRAATSDVPGSLLRVEVAPGPLGAGVGPTAFTMYEYDDVWTTPTPATAAVSFPAAGDPDWFLSGYGSGADELRGTANVVDEQAGSGRVVLFSTDPNYRAFTDGTQQVLRNALGRVPSGASPVAARATVSSSTTEVPTADALVLSVRSSAARTVARLLDGVGASYRTVRTPRGVTYVVDLGGLGAEEHPWARSVADQVAALGDDVLAVRLP